MHVKLSVPTNYKSYYGGGLRGVIRTYELYSKLTGYLPTLPCFSLLVDGPFSSPMEDVSRNEVAICVAAGVGITPFVAVLYEMLQ